MSLQHTERQVGNVAIVEYRGLVYIIVDKLIRMQLYGIKS